jgi:hypothetical protein
MGGGNPIVPAQRRAQARLLPRKSLRIEVRAMRDGLLDLLVSWIVRFKWSATNQLR